MNGDIASEQRLQLLHVAAAGCRKEGSSDLQPLLFRHGESWSCGADIDSGAAGELAAGRRLTADRLCDLVETDAENVMEQEGRALQRRQAFERDHERQRDIVDLLVPGFHDRFWQPRPDVGLAPSPG